MISKNKENWYQKRVVIGDCVLFLGDCFEIIPVLDCRIDLLLTDPPYGVTKNAWDAALDMPRFWEMLKPAVSGAVIITATEPFASEVVLSNKKDFRYDLVWEKGNAVGFLNAKKMPLRAHENILVFYGKLPPYTPQKFMLKTLSFRKAGNSASSNYGSYESVDSGVNDGSRYPRSVFSIKTESIFYNTRKKKKMPMHPTQKPVALMEYLATTYTFDGAVVCDPFMGSGTAGVACVNRGLRFIGVEREEKYFNIAVERISMAFKTKPRLFDAIPKTKAVRQQTLF